MSKSFIITYLCWFTGGLFGLHHLYLGRFDHAFITLATFGGYFGMGNIRDLWRLPEYIRDANNDPTYLNSLHEQIRLHKKPPSTIFRQSGMMIMGNLLGYLVEFAIPSELLSETTVIVLKFTLIPFASALGVWLVGNVGRHQGPFDKPLIASYLGASVFHILNIKQFGSLSTMASFFVFNRYCKEWRIKPRRSRSTLIKLFIFTFCVALYLSLWSSWLYFNCSIEDPETGEQIKCRTAYQNFIQSSAYTHLSEALWIFYNHVHHQGFSGLWNEVMQEFDVSGRTKALEVLDLPEGASKQEILNQCKQLPRKLHPDRERDESKKLEQHEKFIQVQDACRKLITRAD